MALWGFRLLWRMNRRRLTVEALRNVLIEVDTGREDGSVVDVAIDEFGRSGYFGTSMNDIAEAAGVAVPKTVILPHKALPTNTQDTTFRNLQYPLDWNAVFEYIGFPAFMKPHDGGGWRGVTKVDTPEAFFEAYNASGTDCMMLQEGIAFEDYFRCYGIGQKDVRIMRYNPGADNARTRYTETSDAPIPAKLEKRLKRDVLALCRALGYDVNTVEFAVRDGVPYAIDFMNPAPDADYHTVGAENYEHLLNDGAIPGVMWATAVFSVGLVVLNMSLALLLAILVNANGDILIEEQPASIRDVGPEVKKHTLNQGRDPNYAESIEQAIVSLKTDRQTPYDVYVAVLDAYFKALRELRDDEARREGFPNYAAYVAALPDVEALVVDVGADALIMDHVYVDADTGRVVDRPEIT